jgi:hypothetical protein
MSQEFELIEIEKIPNGDYSKKVRLHYWMSTYDAHQKAMQYGAEGVRRYYNNKNLRKRKKEVKA